MAGLLALAPQESASPGKRLDQYSRSCICLLLSAAVAAGLGAFTAMRGDLWQPARGSWRGRSSTGGFARQPAHWPRNRGGTDRHHACSGGRSGIAGAQPDEGAGSGSRVPRGQDRHHGRFAAVGGRERSEGKGRSGDFLFEPHRPPETNSGRAQSWRNQRPSDGWRSSRRDVPADDAKGGPEDASTVSSRCFARRNALGMADFGIATTGYSRFWVFLCFEDAFSRKRRRRTRRMWP